MISSWAVLPTIFIVTYFTAVPQRSGRRIEFNFARILDEQRESRPD